MMQLTQTEAQKLLLISQGLHKSSAFGLGKSALLSCIEHLGYVQIDSISVINRAHHHTLWTRIPSYQEGHLNNLQQERKIFEYWFHAAAYLPIKDYRFCLPYMNAIANGQRHWFRCDKKIMKMVLERIQVEGPLMARHFAPPKQKKAGEWWDWKPAKQALEQLFIEGKLSVSHRVGFHKVYDLPERVLPAELDISTPSQDEFLRYLIMTAIRSYGLVTEQEISYLRKGIKPGIKSLLNNMLEEEELLKINVEGSSITYYSNEPAMQALSKERLTKNINLLCPFDNAIIQRKRISQLFNFDYQVECYVPANKRKYGYYSLPIFFGTEIVGRLDPKADRKNKVLIIQNLSLETKIRELDSFANKLANKLKLLARFNSCQKIIIKRSNSKPLQRILLANLSEQ